MKSVFCVLLILCCAAAYGQREIRTAEIAPLRPKMVLNILVDNLTNQQLQLVMPRLGDGGFKRLMQGTRLEDAYYDAGGNYSGKNLATLFTGASAGTHGIIAEQWIDYFSGRKIHAIYGDAYNLQGEKLDTLAQATNKQLVCSTIGNEIRKLYNDKAKIFSVGLNAQDLMWCSGTKIAEPVVCFSTRTGDMVATNVYDTKTKSWIDNFNEKRFADISISKIWAPEFDITTYHQSKFFPEEKREPFYHSMRPLPGTPDKLKYGRLKGSPFANTIVRDFATVLMLMEDMGKDEVPDMLTVEFTACPSVGHKQMPLDAETEDMLILLDRNIESLLKAIDANIGMHNVLVVFTSARGALNLGDTDSGHWKTEGAVSLHKASALLNLYLMALHGQAKWVKNYSSEAIYLDKELIKQKGLNLDSMLQKSARFLLEVKGIENAIVAKNLDYLVSDKPIIKQMRRNYNAKRSGDILVYLQPGWGVEDDEGNVTMQQWAEEQVPLMFYGWRIPHQLIYKSHNMTDVAPTIAEIIGVMRPNASEGETIEILK